MFKRVFRADDEFRIESLLLLLLFPLSWIGFGAYTGGFLLLLFLFALFFKKRRVFLLEVFKDRVFIALLGLFVLNSIVSSLLSVDPVVSTSLSVVWFFLIFVPVSYVRFSMNRDNDLFVRWIVPAAFYVSIVIVAYLYVRFFHTLATEGLVWKKYYFYFLSAGSTPDMILVLGGMGYGWIRRKGTGRKNLWLGFLYLLFCLSGLVLSRDRGGAVAFFILMVIVLSFDPKRLLLFLGIVAAVFLLSLKVDFLSGVRYMYSYLYNALEMEGLKTRTQIACFRAAWGMIRDGWFFGVGTNNFWTFSDQYGPRKFAYAHNIVLQFWAENGIIGMLTGLGMIALFILRWIKTLRVSEHRYIVLGMGAGFIAMLVGQLTNSTIWAFQSAIPFWLLAGAINAMYYTVRHHARDT